MEETATLAFAVGIYLLTEDIFCLSCGVVGHDTTRFQAVGLPLPIEMMLGGMVPIVGLAMWSIIHKSKKALLLMHGSKTEETNGNRKPNKH
jgi:hypothetical protein